MSEEHDADETVERGCDTEEMPESKSRMSVNRRSFVRRLGAASGTAALPLFAAQPTEAQGAGIEANSVTASEKRKAIATAQNNSEFRQLQEYLRQITDQTEGNTEVEMYETTDDNGEPYHVVGFTTRFSNLPEKEPEAKSSVGVTLKNDAIRNVGATRTVFDDEGLPEKVVEYNVTSNGIQEQETRISIDRVSDEGGMFNIEFDRGSGDSDQVSTLINECSLCKDAANLGCGVGCSLGGYVACGILNVAAPACAAIYAGVCAVIGTYGCGRGAGFICRQNGSC